MTDLTLEQAQALAKAATPERIVAWVWDLPYRSKSQGKPEWSAALYPGEQDCTHYVRADLLETAERERDEALIRAGKAEVERDGHMRTLMQCKIEMAELRSRLYEARAEVERLKTTSLRVASDTGEFFRERGQIEEAFGANEVHERLITALAGRKP